ncbi:MAG: MFS transporter, partial [Pseudoalteromonas sp.]
LVSRLAPASQKGSAMGVYSSSQFFGAFLGGILGGYVAQVMSAQAVFAAAALVGLIWLILAWKMQVPPKSKIISLMTQLSSEQQAQTLASRLVALPGVLEATVVRDENRSYLKINDKEFDLDQARKMAGLS